MAMYLGSNKVSPTLLQVSTPMSVLSVNQNGIYNAAVGTAYSQVNVNIQDGVNEKYLSVFNRTIISFSGSETTIQPYTFIACSNLTTASFSNCSLIGAYAFYSCSNLTTISFPNCSYIDYYAFCRCYSLTAANFPNCSIIGSSAFFYCSNLTTANFPNCSSIEAYAFYNCSNLTTISFLNCSYIGQYVFCNCSNLTTISFPNCSDIDNYAFRSCYNLTIASFPNCSYIGVYAFASCYNLISLYLMSTSIVLLQASNTFSSTPIGGYSVSAGQYGSIYVPASLLASYKAETNWSYFSDRFVGV